MRIFLMLLNQVPPKSKTRFAYKLKVSILEPQDNLHWSNRSSEERDGW